MCMYLVFDCETTGLFEKGSPIPRLVQLAWQLHDLKGALLAHKSMLVRPDGFDIPFQATQIHGISTEKARKEGTALAEVISAFDAALQQAQCLVGHNLGYDIPLLVEEYAQLKTKCQIRKLPKVDTMWASKDWVAIPKKGKGKAYKPPKLTELYEKLFDKSFPSAHNAAFDVAATATCFFTMLKEAICTSPIKDAAEPASITYEAPPFFASMLADAQNTTIKSAAPPPPPSSTVENPTKNVDNKLPFAHLHVHSQHSIIPSTLSVQEIVRLAKSYGLAAVALTDMGNLCGAFSFMKAAKEASILPIIGCEYFLSEQRKQKQFTRDAPDRMYRQPLLAKDRVGYQNLCKLSSLGYAEGFYGIYPRVDKTLLKEYKTGLIALSGSLAGELPALILSQGVQRAENALHYWVETFGEDFYLELFQHGSEEETHVNEILLNWAQKYNLPVLPVQEIFYANEEHIDTHDTLLCIKDQLLKSAPIGIGRGKRNPMVEKKHHFCSPKDMYQRFSEHPESFTHLARLLEKIAPYELASAPMLPEFPLPKGFDSDVEYLRHLAHKGAKTRYSELSQAVEQRMKEELQVVSESGYAGYFLIVHDIVSQAREMDVVVGPGRGSAAGSLIAYVLGITQIDPLAYGLLFERFLNRDRISMPDIDIDFDDENRERLVAWVSEKYGRDQVAQISTYGTMAARSAIRDCARVLEMPLDEADSLAKQVPLQPGYVLKTAFAKEPLKSLRTGHTLAAKVLEQAENLEGTVRHVGTHACGLIISSKPLMDTVPLMYTKDALLPATQYDNSVVEEVGLLKMDFLGLRTLSILRSAIQEIKYHYEKDIQISDVPLTDAKTYEFFQEGKTAGIFQFESNGMQRYLRDLKPDRFEDLIAMNALYRPGPMEYIDSFIARKHGREPISYILPEMEHILSETYGITVYQEQVMQLSERLAGFSKNQADTLRYAMGKKKRGILDQLKPQFLAGATQNGHPKEAIEKIWKDWEAFSAYAFNKSHATCYSLLAYQTAYLRANFPAAYMASVLTHQQGNVEKIAFFIEECRNSGIKILPPNVNKSKAYFTISKDPTHAITFGLGAIKGVGQGATEAICAERSKNGDFEDIYNFAYRLSAASIVSKKTYEALAQAGAFDALSRSIHRRQYLEAAAPGEKNGIESALKWAQRRTKEEENAQNSLFGQADPALLTHAKLPDLDPYSEEELLDMEKESIGVYVSSHPLDKVRSLIPKLCNLKLGELRHPELLNQKKKYSIIGYVVAHEARTSQKGHAYGKLSMEDDSGRYVFMLWRDIYQQQKKKLIEKKLLFVEGMLRTSNFQGTNQEFEIHRIYRLPEELPVLLQKLTLSIPAQEAKTAVFDEIEALLKESPGNCTLALHLEDEKMTARFTIKKYATTPTPNLIEKLEKLPHVTIKPHFWS